MLTDAGRESLVRSRWRETEGPRSSCDCSTCVRFSAAYLHHLFRAQELLAHRPASVHNLRYMARLSARMRQAILEQRFGAWRADFLGAYRVADEDRRQEQRSKRLAAREGRAALDGLDPEEAPPPGEGPGRGGSRAGWPGDEGAARSALR